MNHSCTPATVSTGPSTELEGSVTSPLGSKPLKAGAPGFFGAQDRERTTAEQQPTAEENQTGEGRARHPERKGRAEENRDGVAAPRVGGRRMLHREMETLLLRHRGAHDEAGLQEPIALSGGRTRAVVAPGAEPRAQRRLPGHRERGTGGSRMDPEHAPPLNEEEDPLQHPRCLEVPESAELDVHASQE